MTMGIVKFFTERPVLVHLSFCILLVWGGINLYRAPLDVYPDLELYEVIVTTVWPGAGADEVERLVTEPLEEQLDEISDVQRMVSWSRAGISIIDVKFEESISQSEMAERLSDIRAAVDEVNDLPPDSERPIVQNLTIDEVWPVIYVGVLDNEGNREHLLRAVAQRLERRLEALPGVRSAQPQMQRDRQLIAEVDRTDLERYDLTLSEVVSAVAAEAEDAPAGDLNRGEAATEGTTAISAAGAIEGPESLGERIVRRIPEGGHIRLSEVAQMIDGFEDHTVIVRLNGRPTAALGIIKKHSANAIDVVSEIREAIEHFETDELPPGLSIALSNDTTQIIHSRLRVLFWNLGQGSILVLLTLVFALGVRQSILAIIGLPFSFISAFIVLGAMNVSLNAMTIFSMVLVAGMVVDDAIIVLENIHRHFERGKRGIKAVLEAVEEVFWPVVSAIATTVAAFLPLLMMSGVMGEFFKIIPQTVIAVLVASLVEALIILPGHYLEFGIKPSRRETHAPKTMSDRVRHRIDMTTRTFSEALAKLVGGLVAHRYTVATTAFVLMIACFGLVAHLKTVLFPSDYQIFLVNVTSRPGSTIEQTSDLVGEVEDAINTRLGDTVLSFLTTVGQGWTADNTMETDPVIGQIIVEMTDKGGRDADGTRDAIRDEILAHLAALPDLPYQSIETMLPQDGPPLGKSISIQVRCSDYDSGRAVAERIRADLAGMAGVRDLAVNLRTGLRRADLLLNDEVAASHNMTFDMVARELQMANFGAEVGRWFDDEAGERVDVWVRLAQGDRDSLSDLVQVPVRTPDGALLQLQDVADFDIRQELTTRYHRGGDRCVMVTAEVDNETLTTQDANEYLQANEARYTAGYPGVTLEYGGQFEETQESFGSLIGALVVALLLIFTILAVQFNSVVQPMIIGCAIPFAGAGVILGMWLFGFEFTYPTGVAMVGLTGVVINDSLVLVDFINRTHRENSSLIESVCDGVRTRFRPIMLTTLTTIGGLLPMAVGTGGYSLIWSPFAAALIFGMISSTVMNLLIVPCLYVIAEDFRALRHRIFKPRHDDHEWTGAVRE